MGELQLTNDDLHNILGGIGEAIVIVDMDLRIRRYTRAAEKLLNLVPGDAGRSVSLLNAFITGQRIEKLAAQTIERLASVEIDVLCSDWRLYTLRVSPYKTLDHSIKGAVIALVAAGTGAPHQPADKKNDKKVVKASDPKKGTTRGKSRKR
jgi:two-component system CheB/CheR fusion protein